MFFLCGDGVMKRLCQSAYDSIILLASEHMPIPVLLYMLLALELHELVIAVAHSVRQSNQILHMTEFVCGHVPAWPRAERLGQNFCNFVC